ncbi:MAG: hypothetical protein GKR98_16780 [Boseongicola sp.]|nr:MAG: hypothetical protein GKR98_16780 [Boseongicola sp.]
MRNFCLLLIALAQPVGAQDRALSPEEFEAIVTGQTLLYSSMGRTFGAEKYLPNRQVRWSFLDGICEDGEWYVSGDLICFIYETIEGPQCWSFFLNDGRIMARFENDPGATELYETDRQSEPLYCLGPEIGV